MCIVAQKEIMRLNNLRLLAPLLVDKTSKSNIIWATDAYNTFGEEYRRDKEILVERLIAEPFRLMSRVEKALDQQSERTKAHAEVFTPLWVVKKMNDYMEAEWFEHDGAFDAERVVFPKGKSWQKYVDSRRLEITCGEAPYLATRYDVSTGDTVPLAERVGILDRKLRVVSENTSTDEEWLEWAYRAFEATYGYEFQGDNVLLARLNLLLTFDDYMYAKLQRTPTTNEYKHLVNIITWNIWQMDGLTGTIPYCKAPAEYMQLTMFDPPDAEEPINEPPPCRIFDWRAKSSMEFRKIKEEKRGMKFDFIIGNPPYQDETVGDQKTFAPPIYHKFIDAARQVSEKVMLIHPARFLFNAGNTPKQWNRQMLHDTHFKVLMYEQDSSKVFSNTEIKGGIVISYCDAKKSFGEIGTFTVYSELNSILKKVRMHPAFESFSTCVISRTAYRLTDVMHQEHPEALSQLSDGHPYDMSTNIFDRLPQIFFDERPQDSEKYIQILGRTGNERVYKYVKEKYVNKVLNLHKYKVFLSSANSSGAFGEALTPPIIGVPDIGSTETFVSIGAFDTPDEANAASKYIKTKFARALLGVLKVTQHITPEKWAYVPLQDFTPPHSDIDWSKPIAKIDRQLYAKYGLDDAEIEFIETHVKEMN